jgi:hypothetical protein
MPITARARNCASRGGRGTSAILSACGTGLAAALAGRCQDGQDRVCVPAGDPSEDPAQQQHGHDDDQDDDDDGHGMIPSG